LIIDKKRYNIWEDLHGSTKVSMYGTEYYQTNTRRGAAMWAKKGPEGIK